MAVLGFFFLVDEYSFHIKWLRRGILYTLHMNCRSHATVAVIYLKI